MDCLCDNIIKIINNIIVNCYAIIYCFNNNYYKNYIYNKIKIFKI